MRFLRKMFHWPKEYFLARSVPLPLRRLPLLALPEKAQDKLPTETAHATSSRHSNPQMSRLQEIFQIGRQFEAASAPTFD